MAENSAAEPGAEAGLSQRIAAKANRIKYLVLAVFILLAAGAGIASYLRSAVAEREAEAENRVYQTLVNVQTNPEEDALPVLSALSSELRGTPAGARALMMQFSYAFNTRNFEEAERAARDFVASYPKSPLAGRANLALGQALVMQGKYGEAIPYFEGLVQSGGAEVLPEARLALAQAYEQEAEAVKDTNHDAYIQNLEKARREYDEIVIASTAAGRQSFWPQAVTVPADFALVVIKDKIAGYEHQAPRTPAGSSLTAPVMATPPPEDDTAEGGAAAEAGAEEETAAEDDAAAGSVSAGAEDAAE